MKKFMKKVFIPIILICFSTMFCGCWDYVEITDLKYVAGMAVDKDKKTNEYILTFEVLEASVSAKTIRSNIVESRGKTIHTAFRDSIKKTGKMFQMSHAKVIIVSEEIAREGIIPVIDLINRDVEVRNDMWILISTANTASSILTKEKSSDEIVSYELADAFKSSNKIGKYISVEAFKFADELASRGSSTSAPLVNLINENNKSYFLISGTAVFKKDKMVGVLSEKETVTLEILKGKNPKLVISIVLGDKQNISLELISVKRKQKVNVINNKLYVDMYINMDVAISELAEEGVDYINKNNREKVEKHSEQVLKKESEKLIKKLQREYNADILALGDIVKKKKPKVWEKISNKWGEVFKSVEVNVVPSINIKYSGLIKRNLRVGE